VKGFSSSDVPSDLLNGIKRGDTGGTYNTNWKLGEGK